MGIYDEKSGKWMKPRKPTRSPADSGNNGPCNCNCPMVKAVQSVKRRQFRQASRYAKLGVRTILGRIVWNA